MKGQNWQFNLKEDNKLTNVDELAAWEVAWEARKTTCMVLIYFSIPHSGRVEQEESTIGHGKIGDVHLTNVDSIQSTSDEIV